MCGIAGWLTKKPGVARRDVLVEMANAISHRGPDGVGYYSDAEDERAYCQLAHRRLAIIDLEGGKQPMVDEAGGVALVYNGEIYNFRELRRELENLGCRFETHSDTEVVLRAYQQWGEQCVNRFRGMFAFAIWDDSQKQALIARDPFGKKPLFFHQTESCLVFASEIKSILKFPGVEAEPDLASIWDYLVYRYVPAPSTMFSGIRKLPPGTYAVWSLNSYKEVRYYEPPDRVPHSGGAGSADPVDEFLSRLDESVRIRMVSDVPFGAFLSGGLDSSSIVSLMSRHSELPINTFSVGFAEAKYSELPYCRQIAKQYNAQHFELLVSERELIDYLPSLVAFRDAPVAEPSDIPIYLLSREAGKHVKMVLTGEGSDEVIGGYPKHVYERYVGLYQAIPGILRRGLIEPLIGALPYRFRRAKTAAFSMGIDCAVERFPRWFGAMSFSERAALASDRLPRRGGVDGVQFAFDESNSRLRKILYFDQTSWLPDNLLERGDRMTMAASIEARMPFMDTELARYVSSLADRDRVRGMTTKWILREAMQRVLPREILRRPKVGFRVPVNEWFRGPMRDYLADHLLGSDSRTKKYFQNQQLQRIVSEHLSGRVNHEKVLWMLLNLELWHRHYASSA